MGQRAGLAAGAAACRLAALGPRLPWPPNVWMGVSIESDGYRTRITQLRNVPAAVRFLSLEPLPGPIPALPLDRIAWVIVGGESGPGARPMDREWVRVVRDQCLRARVPFFFKQWGGRYPKANGQLLDGREWNQYPISETDFQIDPTPASPGT